MVHKFTLVMSCYDWQQTRVYIIPFFFVLSCRDQWFWLCPHDQEWLVNGISVRVTRTIHEISYTAFSPTSSVSLTIMMSWCLTQNFIINSWDVWPWWWLVWYLYIIQITWSETNFVGHVTSVWVVIGCEFTWIEWVRCILVHHSDASSIIGWKFWFGAMWIFEDVDAFLFRVPEPLMYSIHQPLYTLIPLLLYWVMLGWYSMVCSIVEYCRIW